MNDFNSLTRSTNRSPPQTTSLNQLMKRTPVKAGSGASSPGCFTRNVMCSSLFAVLELGVRCAARLSRSGSDACTELSCESIGLTCEHALFAVLVAASMWLPGITIIIVVVIYAGELALNSLLPWRFVKHHDLLSTHATISHGALANVIRPSAALTWSSWIVSAKLWMNSSTNVPYWTVVLRVGCVLSQVIAASGDLSFWSWTLHLHLILQTLLLPTLGLRSAGQWRRIMRM